MTHRVAIRVIVCGLLMLALLLTGCAGSQPAPEPVAEPAAPQSASPDESSAPPAAMVVETIELEPAADAAVVTDDFYDPFETDAEEPFGDEDELLPSVADPFSGVNRVVFAFNDKLYFWVLKPVASGYRFVVPTPVRTGIKNFFFNLGAPVRMVNCLLQGKGRSAGAEMGRFLVNTLGGLGGVLDPASQQPFLNPPEEDFGQTLGSYAIGNGFYIVWPLLGPSTLRDTVGMAGDWALSPLGFIQLANIDAGDLTRPVTGAAVTATQTINDTSFRIGDYEALKNAALDPYEAFRDAYIQNRSSKIAQ